MTREPKSGVANGPIAARVGAFTSPVAGNFARL
jgi:hypothetical protein